MNKEQIDILTQLNTIPKSKMVTLPGKNGGIFSNICDEQRRQI